MIQLCNHEGVLEVVLANPPVNALSGALRRRLAEVIADAQTDATVRALVIRGSGRVFSAGADISEFGKPAIDPLLPRVVDAIEASAKPVVAAIQGVALGGGLEVALGCHYRIATPAAKLGLPEVKLGLVPGAGGTQRLPRLVGAEAALGMIVFGEPIPASKGAQIGLVDQLVEEGELATQAIAFARRVDGVRRASAGSVRSEAGLFERFGADNLRRIDGLDAPKACIEAVRAATELTFRDGQQQERALFNALVAGAQSKALRHVFFAERSAAKIEGLPKELAARTIHRVGVIGAGTMGAGIAMNFLSAGIAVTLVEIAAEVLARGVATVRDSYQASVAKGRMTHEQLEQTLAWLAPTLDFGALQNCDLVIEAAYENMAVKQGIFQRLDAIAKPGAILASNTSYLSIDAIAAATSRPADVLGMHFFSPANVMKLVEVVRGAGTAHAALATALQLARRIGKVPVVARVCYGFIGNRMLIPRQQNATALLLEGATPEQVDRVHTRFGMPMGPFQMADLAGIDIGWHRDPQRIDSIRDALCAEERWGQKRKAGYYDYDDRRKPTPSAAVERIIEQFRAKAGIQPRAIDDEEIMVRTIYTMVNEGAKIVEEGIAQRASDIDVVWIHGYGWPRHTGGPMYWAGQTGLDRIVAGLERYRERLGADFELSRLLVNSAATGDALERLSGADEA